MEDEPRLVTGTAGVVDRLMGWVILVASACTLGMLILATTPWEAPASALGGIAALTGWCVSPYLGLAAVRRLARSPGQRVLSLVVSAGTASFGLLVLGDVLVVHRGLLNALVTMVVPGYQWGAVLAGGAAVLIWRLAQRGESAP
ncbi:MAG: hypothetical protein KA072_02855 [Thermoanaerobaculaceae bacterium]|nr:hypothetical protein [Thermoanaerobaculaceae bacterium]MDI9620542.1 hypothetical protein [Acidobacteriota bacterium]NLH11937.1 hypothetical protein [Holophagae bacterium]HPW55219.1 hypothetical protein [Thermoanaerobaculaceae bacterium]